MIELREVCKSFAHQPVLRHINLFIQEGEIFGIVGRSGAGKSTLLRCINGLEHPDKGQVLIEQHNICELKGRALCQLRHKIGMVFQHFNLLNTYTVFDNIALPMRIQKMSQAHIENKIKELLPLVELQDKVHCYPNQLSGGQKQRVAIARALSCSPKILLCDEATSALDPETTQSILTLLQKINRLYGISIVLITHEMAVVKQICHRLAIMDAGKIIETTDIATAFSQRDSVARSLLYSHLSPKLPECLKRDLSATPNNRPLLQLLFEGETATGPFISQISRELSLDVTILQANIDRFNGITCGVLVVELHAQPQQLQAFIQRCQHVQLIVEVLGYVHNEHSL